MNDLAPERQFDFWLGEWALTWAQGGVATNRIVALWDGRVIQENFADTITGFYGISHSAYNAQRGVWQQTWVDSNGSYLDFVGQFKDGRMELRKAIERDGEAMILRMVWRDIAANSFEWDWQRSTDDGVTWETMWHIHYQRVS
jgi:hypothetical protein